MSAGDVVLFDRAKLNLVNGVHVMDTDVIKLAILTNAVVPVEGAAAPIFADYTEVTTAGTYTAGGITLTVVLSEVSGIGKCNVTNNPTWLADALNGTDAYWGLIYNDSDATKRAIGFIDLGGVQDMVAEDLNVIWHPNGLFSFQVIG